jgi:hypothetical protein
MNMKFKTVVFSLIVLGLSTSSAQAASISVKNPSDFIQVGDILTVQINLNTEGKQINAVEAQVKYSTDSLIFNKVNDGDSIINLWVEEPTLTEPGTVTFSGITPGGFSGSDVGVLTIQFEAIKEGVGSVMLENVQLLLHDGLGTPLQATIVPLAINIQGQSTAPSPKTQYIDQEAPEPFTPIITTDPDIFDGRKFLVFSTEDKGSGVDYYEVKEGEFGTYEFATSPYEIKDQTLESKIFVRAVDRDGNEYEAIVYPQNFVPWYETTAAKTAIIIVCSVILLFLVRRFFAKSA